MEVFSNMPFVFKSSTPAVSSSNSFKFVNRDNRNTSDTTAISLSTWSTGSGIGISAEAMTYGNNLYVAVGQVNGISTSTNGNTWTTRTVGFSRNDWTCITYGNGLYVALAAGIGNERVMTSTDAINWTVRNSATPLADWRGVAYGNGIFVGVAGSGTSGSPGVMSSTNGITWTGRYFSRGFSSVVYGNGVFVAIPYSGTGVITSTDGINWTSQTGINGNWYDITYGNGLFVAVGYNGYNSVMTSPDGTNWTSQNSSSPRYFWTKVTYGNGLFVAVSGTGVTVSDTTFSGGGIMTSMDGISWTVTSISPSILNVAAGSGSFTAGISGNSITSTVVTTAAKSRTFNFKTL
jgi:hypothetical protein